MIHTLAISPWANPQVIVAILGLLTAVLGAGGAWELRNAKKRKRLSAEEAERAQAIEDAAAADQMVTSAMTIVSKWEDMAASITSRHDHEISKMNARLDAECQARHVLQAEVDTLKRESHAQAREIFTLRTSLSRVLSWWDAIADDWARIRQMETPPAFPPIKID